MKTRIKEVGYEYFLQIRKSFYLCDLWVTVLKSKDKDKCEYIGGIIDKQIEKDKSIIMILIGLFMCVSSVLLLFLYYNLVLGVVFSILSILLMVRTIKLIS